MYNQPPDALIGKTLGQFEIIDELGRGGMATVYRAKQKNINRTVAIKVLPRALLHDPSFYERFTREVDVIAHLEHPHILPIYDYGEVDGIPYIAMRYLAGGSMAQWIRRRVPGVAELARPLVQIGQALDYAHHQGIIHRDLKPGNILLDERGNAYLTDFGIAKVLNSNLTGSAIIGTPAYMSPEQAKSIPLDARSDVYSLGIVLFEMLTGREPYEAETPVALLYKHITEPMPSARATRTDLPEAIDEIVQKATAKNANDRYPSAGDLAQAYADAVGGLPRTRPNAESGKEVPYGYSERGTPLYNTPPESTPNLVEAVTVTPLPGARQTPTAMPQANQTPASISRAGTAAPLPPDSVTLVNAPTRPRRNLLPLIIGGVAAVVVAFTIAVFVTTPPPAPIEVTPTPQPPTQPTAFANATLASDERYTLAVPAGWRYADVNDNQGGQTHIWRDGIDGGDAYISLHVDEPNATPITAEQLQARMEAWAARYPASAFTLIDEVTAPNGVVRRSYRIADEDSAGLAEGQVDSFYVAQAPYFAVLELYASDEEGERLHDTFQQVLDSLQLGSV